MNTQNTDPFGDGRNKFDLASKEIKHSGPSALHASEQATVAGEIGDAEAGNLKVRLVAIENILVALLASASEEQLELVREMANYILPRPGTTPHRITIEAARNILAIVERAEHHRGSSRAKA